MYRVVPATVKENHDGDIECNILKTLKVDSKGEIGAFTSDNSRHLWLGTGQK